MKRLALILICTALPRLAAAADWAEVSAIFEERCTVCHSGEFAPMALALDTHAGVMAGSETGPVILTDAPGESPLLHRIDGRAEPRMPMDGPPWLEDAQVAAIADWIAAGAPGPVEGDPAPAAEASPPPDPRADGRITYDEVSTIFGQRCIECHSDNSKLGAPPEGLKLDSLEAILTSGERLVLVPGNPAASNIIRHVTGRAEPRMPMDGPPWLSEEQIVLLEDWIAEGALDAEGNPAALPVGRELRLRGVLSAPDALDGAMFRIGPGTRIDKSPKVGDEAELRGRIAPDGVIEAERLRRR